MKERFFPILESVPAGERYVPPESRGHRDEYGRRTMKSGIIKPFNIPERKPEPEITEHTIVSPEELAGKREKAFNDKP